MDLSNIKDAFETVLEIVKGDIEDTSYGKIKQQIPEFVELVDTIAPALADGLDFGDMVVLAQIVEPLMVIAGKVGDYTGKEKKQFVIDAIWLTYRTIDTYPDGTKNNINIPFLWGRGEERFERKIVTLAAGWAINGLYKRMKKDGDV